MASHASKKFIREVLFRIILFVIIPIFLLILSEIDNLVIPTSTIWESEAVYGWQAGNFDLILINSCDYRCEERDIECKNLKDNFLELVNSENKLLKKLDFSLERMYKDEIVSVENCEVLLFEV